MPTNILEDNAARSRREKRNALGISHPTRYRLIKDGKSKTIKLGSCWLVPLDAIDALLMRAAQ